MANEVGLRVRWLPANRCWVVTFGVGTVDDTILFVATTSDGITDWLNDHDLAVDAIEDGRLVEACQALGLDAAAEVRLLED